jgi:hypothetical protein
MSSPLNARLSIVSASTKTTMATDGRRRGRSSRDRDRYREGFLVADEAAMAEAVKCLGSIDPAKCRARVAKRYDVSITAARYEPVYHRAITADRRHHRSRATWNGPERLLLPASPAV